MKGILAQKIGMTRILSPDTGDMVPVTLCFVPKNKILQIKNTEKDGYDSVVLAAFERNKKFSNIGKQFKFIKEINFSEVGDMKKDTEIDINILKDSKKVKITAISKGKGFAGVIKRHNFARGRETHGSHHHREPGSIGMCAKPARVLKGKKMPGHLGAEQVSIKNVEVIEIDPENNLIALKGAIPGAKKGYLIVSEG